MALATRFRRLLKEATDRRTAAILRQIIPAQGKPKRLTRRIRKRLRKHLLLTATEILVRERAKEDFAEITKKRYLRFIKGRGIAERYRRLVGWAQKKATGPIVYAFWDDGNCLYVGKGKNYKRLRAYQKSYYLKSANSMEVWRVRGKSRLPSAECLAIHMFEPRDNKNKPARVKWGKGCRICARHDEVKDELDTLLRLRG